MTERGKNDERRFNFCLGCLKSGKFLIEHHLKGRNNEPGNVVFICEDCHNGVEDKNGPILKETGILESKKALLINSTSLTWVIENKNNIILSFEKLNKDGPLCTNSSYSGFFGAIGCSNRKYFFIEPSRIDDFVEIPTDINPQNDSLGGLGGDHNWMRFKGEENNILNKFITFHEEHAFKVDDISRLKQ